MKPINLSILFVLLSIHVMSAQSPVDSSLVAHFPFNGNANDESGYSNHGSVNGALLTTDRFGNDSSAYEFNGTSSYISVPSSASLESPTTELTQMAWINIYSWSNVGTPFGPILMKSNSTSNAFQYRLNVGQNGHVNTSINNWDNGVIVYDTLNFNEWYFIATTLKDDTVRTYINGWYIDLGVLQGPINPDSRPLEIGRDVPGATEVFNGKIDDVRIYNRALAESEIRELAGISPPALADTGILYGSTGYTNGAMLITIDKYTGTGTVIGPTGLNNLPGLAINSTGEIFTVNNSDLYRVNAADAGSELVGEVDIDFLPAVAFDYNDELYGIGQGFYIDDEWEERWYLIKIDTSTAGFEPLFAIKLSTSDGFGEGWRGMSFDPADGTLFACTEAGDIHTINPFSGETGFIGNTGLGRVPDVAFDNNGSLYASIVSDGGYILAALNKTDGSGNIIGNTGIDKISGLAARTLPLTGPQIAVFPAILDFGIRPSDKVSKKDITIRNIGTSTLTITSITMPELPFGMENISFPAAIEPDSTLTIGISFEPGPDSDNASNITVTSDDADNPQIVVSLQGEGTPTKVLYGVEGNGGILMTIDQGTGASDTLEYLAEFHYDLSYVTEIELRRDGVMFLAPGDGESSLYSYNIYTNEYQFIGQFERGSLTGMDISNEGILYATNSVYKDSSWLVIADQDSATLQFIGKTGYKQVRGLTFSADGTLYGVGPDTIGGETTDILMKIDVHTGAASPVGPTGFIKVVSLEFGPDSVLYAGLGYNVADSLDGGLITIDPETGAGTFTGLTGARVLSGLTFFPNLTDVSAVENEIMTAEGYHLRQNYPNPFNPSTTIEFTLPNSEFVSLKIYNILGKEISTLISGKLRQGNHRYIFNGKHLASGVYLYRLATESGFSETRKFILIK